MLDERDRIDDHIERLETQVDRLTRQRDALKGAVRRVAEENKQAAYAFADEMVTKSNALADRTAERDRARATAVRVEQELARTQARRERMLDMAVAVREELSNSRAEVHRLRQELAASREEAAKLKVRMRLMSEPCRCDPPGSGEEYCNGGCQLRDELAASREEADRLRALLQARNIREHTVSALTRMVQSRDKALRTCWTEAHRLREALSSIQAIYEDNQQQYTSYDARQMAQIACDALSTEPNAPDVAARGRTAKALLDAALGYYEVWRTDGPGRVALHRALMTAAEAYLKERGETQP